MTTSDSSQIATQLLILWLSTVTLISLMLAFVAIVYAQKRRLRRAAPPRNDLAAREHAKVFQKTFERPARWLAIRSANLPAVQSALGLHHARPCSWSDGLARLGDDQLFLSPPVRGWILAFGRALPDPAEDVDECFRFLRQIGREIGGVQFFSVHRALNHHAWVLAEGERILRAYAWAGETVWNQGPVTAAEKALGLVCLPYGEGGESPVISATCGMDANTEKIYALAARWSLDPTALEDDALGAAPGVAGELLGSKQH